MAHERGDRREEHRDARAVGQAQGHVRRAETELEPGLVRLVEEEEGKREREHERAERLPFESTVRTPIGRGL